MPELHAAVRSMPTLRAMPDSALEASTPFAVSPQDTRSEVGRLHKRVQLAVIWIDWYTYHVARLQGLLSAPQLAGRTVGIELVGGIGVHAGLKFREELPTGMPIETVLPDASWRETSQWRLARMLWHKLNVLDPEVVLVPGYYTLPAIAAALWARIHGTASVLMTESTSYDHKRTPWKETVKSLVLRGLFGWAVTGGKAHVDYLRQLNFPWDRIGDSYDVVDNGFFERGTRHLRSSSSAEQRYLPSQPYFLYIGRLAKEKNVAGLLRAWLLYREQGGTWPLVLVGDGTEAATLKSTAAASPFAADVHFTGLLGSRELLPFYAFAGCFVLPSTREPWGLVVNEAMASALPVLVSKSCGCAPDLVTNGLNGFVLDPESEPEFVSLLQRMEAFSPVQRKQMGEASAEIISRYSPERFGSSVAAIVDAVSRQRGGLQYSAEGTE